MNNQLTIKVKKKKKIVTSIVLYSVMIILAAMFALPLFAMISKSMLNTSEFNSTTTILWPRTMKISNYVKVFTTIGSTESGVPYFLLYFWNTAKVVILSTVGLIISASFCAYGFTKIEFPGRNLVFFITLATTMIPSSVMIIPLYSLYQRFGWLDTSLPLWAGMWFGGGAINIFLVMQFLKGLPKELNECSSIDGASIFRQYFQVILPNCKAILAVIAIGSIIGSWNDIQAPLLYLQSQENFTLALGVYNLSLAVPKVDGQVIMAACVMMTIVPLVAFIADQKFFVESVVMSGIKG